MEAGNIREAGCYIPVYRRIGGLENLFYTPFPLQRVYRRIGGLESIDLQRSNILPVYRRIGGLEKCITKVINNTKSLLKNYRSVKIKHRKRAVDVRRVSAPLNLELERSDCNGSTLLSIRTSD